MTFTSRQTRSWPSTLRHLTFASYGSPESATALFVTRCFWLPRASVGCLRSILVGAVVEILVTVLIPSPRSPQPSSWPPTTRHEQAPTLLTLPAQRSYSSAVVFD